MHLGCDRPAPQPGPVVWPHLQVNAVHSVCSRNDGEPNVGQMLSSCRSSWWTDEVQRGAGVCSLWSKHCPARWCCRMSHESHWELTGGSCTGEPSETVRLKAMSPESGCKAPSILAHSLCPGLLFSTRPSPGSQKPFQSCQVLQRLIQTT